MRIPRSAKTLSDQQLRPTKDRRPVSTSFVVQDLSILKDRNLMSEAATVNCADFQDLKMAEGKVERVKRGN